MNETQNNICPRCKSNNYDDSFCWVCYHGSDEIQYIAPQTPVKNEVYVTGQVVSASAPPKGAPDSQTPTDEKAVLAATSAIAITVSSVFSAIMIGIGGVLVGIVLAIKLVLIVIGSILTAIAEACSGCAAQAAFVGLSFWAVFQIITALIFP